MSSSSYARAAPELRTARSSWRVHFRNPSTHRRDWHILLISRTIGEADLAGIFVHCDSRGLIKEGFNQEKMYCITPIRRCGWQSTMLSLVLCFGLQGLD